ncbi:hypothetical protein ACFYY8_33835 [Streptosporangium sp. NPDC001559]|uniref:hypothetical protein n=1 Tax=Streptosporangium sp. NPDC001559 TaxID=3366187 RepID=UPI0036E42B0B
MLVQYLGVAPHLIRTPAALVPSVSAASVYCLLDRSHILDARLLGVLDTLTTTVMAMLTPRQAPPHEAPWGRLHLPLVDEHAGEVLVPRIRPGALVIPLPRSLLTKDLAQTLATLGTDCLRLYDPPPDK